MWQLQRSEEYSTPHPETHCCKTLSYAELMSDATHGRNCYLLKHFFLQLFLLPGRLLQKAQDGRRLETATATPTTNNEETPLPNSNYRGVDASPKRPAEVATGVIRSKIKRKKRRGADPGLQGTDAYITPPPGLSRQTRPPGQPDLPRALRPGT